MMSVRDVIKDMAALGVLPPEKGVNLEILKKYDSLYRSIVRPVSNEEAEVLIGLLGQDDCFGLAFELVHLIETAPGWPIKHLLPKETNNLWIKELRERALRGGCAL